MAEDGTLTVSGAGSALDQQSLLGGQHYNAGITNTHWQQAVRAGSAGVLASFDLHVGFDSTVGASAGTLESDFVTVSRTVTAVNDPPTLDRAGPTPAARRGRRPPARRPR